MILTITLLALGLYLAFGVFLAIREKDWIYIFFWVLWFVAKEEFMMRSIVRSGEFDRIQEGWADLQERGIVKEERVSSDITVATIKRK